MKIQKIEIICECTEKIIVEGIQKKTWVYCESCGKTEEFLFARKEDLYRRILNL